MTALHHRIWGNDAAPPVVLLHAIGTSSAMWTPQLLSWGSRFRIITLDLPGHGGSTLPPSDATFGDYAASVAATLEQLGIRSAAVVGLSFGSMVAMRLAHDRSDLVSSLVLANGVAIAPPPVRRAWAERIATVQTGGMSAIVAGTLERWFTPAFAAAAPMTVEAVGNLVRATRPDGFCAAAQAIATLDQTALLGAIGCPTLVVAGSKDAAAPPEQVADIARAVPGARLIELDAPHMSNIECADAFSEGVGAFLSEVTGQ